MSKPVDIRFEVYWYEIHVFSLNAIGKRKILFDKWIVDLSKRFFCKKCRSHFEDYVRKHPPEKSSDAFKWGFDFHNSVNRRLGKKELSFNEALMEWTSGEIANCVDC